MYHRILMTCCVIDEWLMYVCGITKLNSLLPTVGDSISGAWTSPVARLYEISFYMPFDTPV